MRAVAIAFVCSIGCTVGPKYERPAVGVPAAFREATPAAYRDLPAETWRPARPQDAALKGKWWEIFREPELDALEEQLNVDNQTIAQSFEGYMAARAQIDQARAGYFPTVTLSPSVTHSQHRRRHRGCVRRLAGRDVRNLGRRRHGRGPGRRRDKSKPVLDSARGVVGARSVGPRAECRAPAALRRAGQRRGSRERAADRAGDAGTNLLSAARSRRAHRSLRPHGGGGSSLGRDHAGRGAGRHQQPGGRRAGRGHAGERRGSGRRDRRQPRDLRARDRYADRQAGVRFHDGREDAGDARARDPDRDSVAAARATARHRRRGAHDGRGERAASASPPPRTIRRSRWPRTAA